MNRIIALGGGWALALVLGSSGLRADEAKTEAPKAEAKLDVEALLARSRGEDPNKPDDPVKKYRDFGEVTRGAEKIDGLFTLYRKDDHLYAEIKPFQLDQPLLAPIAIARGLAMAGNPLNFGDEWILVFHRAGDKVQLIRRNIHYKASSGMPLEKAVKQNYTDSILMALPVVSVNPGGGMSVVIDLADIFLTDFAELGIGPLDRGRTSWHKIKAFPNNLELEVEATFGGGRFGGRHGDDGVADPRGLTVVIHYSLVKPPDAGYRPRLADDRIGHFLSASRDFAQNDPDTNFVRQIDRWRLEKADAKAKLSAPKKQIVWWVEDTVPTEYRPFVEAGILEWNKAFEKIGIRNALAVRWQREGEDFDPEDVNYCTFRWITTNSAYAMSGLRANPLTGEMIDGDVIFDANFIRSWKQEYALLTGSGPVSTAAPLAVGEVISPIMAARKGYGQLLTPTPINPNRFAQAGPEAVSLVPADWGDVQIKLRERLANGQPTACQFSTGMQPELGLAILALADAPKAEPNAALPEEFIGQAIKMVAMHEVGHSLGLRHNFKASSMLPADKLNDTTVTHEKGLVGSVMDYAPINLAPKGQKQGDYFTTTLGPYDYWAIEYAYKPIDGDEAAELKKIAARAPEHDLSYATDEDMRGDNDPNVNAWDLGSDTSQFAKERIALAVELMKDLDAKTVKDGESWARNRRAFSILLSQWGNAAYLIAEHVGGQSVHRDHKGDKDGRDPVVPIAGAKQREALALLADQILGDRAFQFSPSLLRRLGTERWYHWGSEGMGGDVDFPIHERILSIQTIVLGQCLDSGVLARLQNQELQADPGTNPLRMAEVFRALTDGIWSDVSNLPPPAEGQPRTLALSTIRRNLQREHLRRLAGMVLGERRNGALDGFLFVSFGGGGSLPADARSLARLHLKEIGDRLAKALDQKDVTIDDVTRAHLDECRQRIAKVLDAGIESNEP